MRNLFTFGTPVGIIRERRGLEGWRVAMRASSWPEYLDQVEIRFPFPIEISAEVNRLDDVCALRVTLTVPDINKPTDTIRVYLQDFAPPFSSVKDPGKYLRNLICRALHHEVDESLFVAGVRWRDPHASEAERFL